MEVVLSTGCIGDNDGSPFRNEEVREWSHVDRLTGMLERARIETGRWQARSRQAAHSYGKVVDSRERNSADGNVVQKARRQVEVFQSQGAGGRSFQVVRASQWSSSRITESSSSPGSISRGSQPQAETVQRKSLGGVLPWNEDDSSRLSQICRKIHEKSMKRDGSNLRDSPVEGSPVLFNGKRSTSNEDIASLVEIVSPSEKRFSRDCKTRRSLQIQNQPSAVSWKQLESEKVVAEVERFSADRRSRNFDDAAFLVPGSAAGSAGGAGEDAGPRRNPEKAADKGTGNLKSYILGMEDANIGTLDTHHSDSEISRSLPDRRKIPIGYQPTTSNTSNRVNNTTVIHLRNDGTGVSSDPSSARNLINVKGVPGKSGDSPLFDSRFAVASKPSSGANILAIVEDQGDEDDHDDSIIVSNRLVLKDPASKSVFEEESDLQEPEERGCHLPGAGDLVTSKPVKKVGFCKTEVHFVADSGKVNIVETDEKPPPSNRFRRRRRSSSSSSSSTISKPILGPGNPLPLIHFGDTSYEKYIFGAAGSGQDLGDRTSSRSSPGSTWGGGSSAVKLKSILDLENHVQVGLKQRGHTTTVSLRNEALQDSENIHQGNAIQDRLCNRSFLSCLLQSLRTAEKSLFSSSCATDLSESPGNRLQEISTGNSSKRSCTTISIRMDQETSISELKSSRLVMNLSRSDRNLVMAGTGRMSCSSRMESVALRNLINLETPMGMILCQRDLSRVRVDRSTGTKFEGLQLQRVKLREVEGIHEIGLKSVDEMLVNSTAGTISPLKQPESATLTLKSDQKPPESHSSANQVLMRVVTTHKPVLARVESDHPVPGKLNPSSRVILPETSSSENSPATRDLEIQEFPIKVLGEPVLDIPSPVSVLIAKETQDPVYANIFEAIGGQVPIYENVPMGAKKGDERTGSPQRKREDSASVDTQPGFVEPEDLESERKPSRSDSRNSLIRKESLPKTEKAPSPGKSRKLEQQNVKSVGSLEKIQGRRSTRDASAGVGKPESKPKSASGSQRTKSESEKRETSRNRERAAIGPSRSKKPVEVVYQTAVFNMKNEKLSGKSGKTKESKPPRCINDLICGSKPKRGTSDLKRVKTAANTQHTSSKGAVSTVRHWK